MKKGKGIFDVGIVYVVLFEKLPKENEAESWRSHSGRETKIIECVKNLSA